MAAHARRQIRCQVVKILSDRDLVIDAGKRKGVERGMIFRIVGSEEIRNPDSKEIIEVVEYEKIRVRVSYVGNEVAVAGVFSYSQSGHDDLIDSGRLFRKEKRMSPDWDRSVKVKDTVIEVWE